MGELTMTARRNERKYLSICIRLVGEEFKRLDVQASWCFRLDRCGRTM